MNLLNFLESAANTLSNSDAVSDIVSNTVDTAAGTGTITETITGAITSATDTVSQAISTTTEAGGASASAGFLGILTSILPFALIILVFYFLMIRPQRKQQKEQEAMRNSIDVGDQITTIGGIVGVVRQIKDDGDIYVIETGANNDRMTIRKWAVQSKDTISE